MSAKSAPETTNWVNFMSKHWTLHSWFRVRTNWKNKFFQKLKKLLNRFIFANLQIWDFKKSFNLIQIYKIVRKCRILIKKIVIIFVQKFKIYFANLQIWSFKNKNVTDWHVKCPRNRHLEHLWAGVGRWKGKISKS